MELRGPRPGIRERGHLENGFPARRPYQRTRACACPAAHLRCARAPQNDAVRVVAANPILGSEVDTATADLPIAVACRLGTFGPADFARLRRLLLGRLFLLGHRLLICVGLPFLHEPRYG